MSTNRDLIPFIGDGFLNSLKDSFGNIESKSPYRWVIVALSWLHYFSFGLIYTALSVLVTPVMIDLNLTYSQMGIILGCWQLVYIFSAQPIGLLIDRVGPYKSLLLGAAIISLSAALRWFAVNFETLIFFVALFGIGGPMISIGLPKLASVWFFGRERGTASGIYATGNTIGAMVALAITNSFVLPQLGDWKKVFLIYSFVGFLIALLWLSLGRRSPDPDTLNIAATPVKRERTLLVMKSVFMSRNIWLIVIIGITSFLTNHGLSNWLPKILELNGMTSQEAGFAVSFLNLFGIFGSILISRLPYIVRSRKLAIAITLLIQGASTLLLGIVGGSVLWLALALDGISRGLLPLLTVTLMELPEVGPRRMGVVGGLYFSIGEIGGFGGPFVMGVLKDITGSFLPGLILMAAISLASITLAAFLRIDVKTKA